MRPLGIVPRPRDPLFASAASTARCAHREVWQLVEASQSTIRTRRDETSRFGTLAGVISGTAMTGDHGDGHGVVVGVDVGKRSSPDGRRRRSGERPRAPQRHPRQPDRQHAEAHRSRRPNQRPSTLTTESPSSAFHSGNCGTSQQSPRTAGPPASGTASSRSSHSTSPAESAPRPTPLPSADR